MSLFNILFGKGSRNTSDLQKTANKQVKNLEKVKNLFYDNPDAHFSALEINKKIHTTEARKYISMLRRTGMAIGDYYVSLPSGVRFKRYYLCESEKYAK